MFDLFTFFIYIFLLTIIIVLTNYRLKSSIYNLDLSSRLKSRQIIALLIISFIVGFRYNVGVDWGSYKNFFEVINFQSFPFLAKLNIGILYYYINQEIASFGLSYEWMFFIVAIISWYFIFKSVPKSLLPLLLFFIFVDGIFFWSMNGVRQFVSISIFLYSIRFIIKREPVKYFSCIFLALLFHPSALLLVPIYFIPFSKLYNQKAWIIAYLISFAFSKNPFLISGLEKFFSNVANFIPILSKYTNYFTTSDYSARQVAGTGLGVVFSSLITFVILIFSKWIIDKNPQTRPYFILYFIGAIMYNLFFTFQIVGRFNMYFLIMKPVVLAILIGELLKSKTYRGLAIIISVLYFFLFLVTIYNSGNLCSPYHFSFLN